MCFKETLHAQDGKISADVNLEEESQDYFCLTLHDKLRGQKLPLV